MSSNEKHVLTLTCAAHFLCHTFELVFPAVLLLLMAEFKTNALVMGVVATTGLLPFGFGAIPMGWLTDRFQPITLIRVYFVGAAASMLFIAQSNSPGVLALGMFCLGLFLSAYHPAGLSLISKTITRGGRGMAIHGIFGNLGLAGAPLLSGALGVAIGWRWTYGLFAIVACLAAGSTWLLRVAVPKDTTTAQPAMATNPGHHNPKPPRTARFEWKWLVTPSLLLLFGMGVCNGMAYRGVMTFLPTHIKLHVSVSLLGIHPVALAGMLSTLILSFGVIGQYIAGNMSDRMPAERVIFLTIIMGVPFLFLMAITKDLWLVVFSVMFAFFHFSTQPPGNLLMSQYTPDNMRGLAYGIYFSMVFGVGALGAALSGWLADTWGYGAVFGVLSVIFALAGLLALLLLRRRAALSAAAG